MKKPFTPESLEKFLVEREFIAFRKRINYGKTYSLTIPGGGNPFAYAMASPIPIEASIRIDKETIMSVTISAHLIKTPIIERKKSADHSSPGDWSLAGSLVAGGKKKEPRLRPVKEFAFTVNIPNFEVIDSVVSEGEESAVGVCHGGEIRFLDDNDDNASNQVVAKKTATATLRLFRAGESYLLPVNSTAGLKSRPDPESFRLTTEEGDNPYARSMDNSASEIEVRIFDDWNIENAESKGAIKVLKDYSKCSDSERKLIRRILAGDPEAVAELISKYTNRICQIARKKLPKYEFEDGVQDMEIAMSRASFDRFDGACSLKSLVCLICNRVCAKYYRDQEKVIRTVSLSSVNGNKSNQVSHSLDPLDKKCLSPLENVVLAEEQAKEQSRRQQVEDERIKAYQQAIKQLGGREREVMELVEQGLSNQEITDKIKESDDSITQGAVRVAKSRAMNKLERFLCE